MKEKVDYLIRGGRVIDPYRQIDRIEDVAVKNGKIANVSGMEVDAAEVVDAAGCIVTPGLIDYHCHVAVNVTDLGISGESTYFPSGVTTVVDAGSTGTANYEAFRSHISNSKLRIKAFLNVCPAGLITNAYHENIDPKCLPEQPIMRHSVHT